jgi:RHS repeat-associated protein
LAYDYDEIRNMIYKSDLGYYNYDSSRPHAVTKVGDKTFSYDANGNMIKNDDKTISYTSFNKPNKIQTPNSTVNFYYDANNSRYKKTSGSTTTHYVGKTYEKNFYANGVKEDKYFIYANGKLVSIFSNKDNQYKVNFLHYDNLGSIDTITNNLGVVEQRRSYKPFGEQLYLDKYGNEVATTSTVTNRGYTGHEHIKEVDLIHMNGRVYDASIARFISADPNIFHPFDSQDFNRYTYTHNNPMKYVDHSGFGMLDAEHTNEPGDSGGYSNDSVGNSSEGYGEKGDGRNSENYGERYGNNGHQANNNYKQRHKDAKKRAKVKRKASFEIAEIERNYLNNLNGETAVALAGLLPIGVSFKVVKVLKTIPKNIKVYSSRRDALRATKRDAGIPTG